MRHTPTKYIQIVLVVITIIGLFLPFVMGVTPVDAVFLEIEGLIGFVALTIPVCLLIPFLLLILFPKVLAETLLKFSKWVLLSLFAVVFCVYVYTFFSHGGVFGRSSIAITISTLFFSFGLVVVSLMFSKNNLQILQNILLGTITLPFIYHLPLVEIGITQRNYGGFIIETAFILLYLISFISVFYERKRA